MGNGHGGARANAGRPRKDLSKAILDGTRPSRLKAVKLDGAELVDETTPTVPECLSYLKDAQRMGVELKAEKFFNDTWARLAACKCEKLFDINYLQRFAMQQARYVQLEELISKLGFLGKTGNGDPRDNPLEAMVLSRLKILNSMHDNIENIIRANCAEPFARLPRVDDPMEAILRG